MPRNNNFDLLRLVLAWMVVLRHCAELSRSPQLAGLIPIVNSQFAVEGFFTISGCLIVASFDRTQTLASYFRRRAERILPGYFSCILFCLAIGTVFTTMPLNMFFTSIEVWKYLAANLLFLNFVHPGLPGVFQTNPFQSALNGALWTLRIEIVFYVFVPLLVMMCRRIGKLWVCGAAFLVSLCFQLWSAAYRPSLSNQFPSELTFFIGGALVYFYYEEFEKQRRWILPLALGLALLSTITGWSIIRNFSTPLLIMSIGLLLPVYRGVTSFGDFSYGVYVLHCPFVQSLVALGVFAVHPWFGIFVVFLSVSTLSIGSWFLIERHFLRRTRVVLQEPAIAGANT